MLLAQIILHKLILRQQSKVQKKKFSDMYYVISFLTTNPV